MNKCKCYEDGHCNGTKEQDRCNCRGDESKCDFYENVRERGEAAKRRHPNLYEIISYIIDCDDAQELEMISYFARERYEKEYMYI